jgi:hypothetical protein
MEKKKLNILKVVANNSKDQEIADQFSKLINEQFNNNLLHYVLGDGSIEQKETNEDSKS